ncbi:receptor-type tyrosine-protein phosphatase S-like [Oscarella lobularis]|uniref:receptor-type tyrosine-protein phosphatase S-like n=1 Tax=Oscarella lobularis TaxID=121494 RepID=UPI003313769B
MEYDVNGRANGTTAYKVVQTGHLRQVLVEMIACYILVIFTLHHVAKSDPDQLVDVFGNVKAFASSSYEANGVKFQARWAADGVASRRAANCFASALESRPWWRLDVGASLLPITNVRIYTSEEENNATGFVVHVTRENDDAFSGELCGIAIRSGDDASFVVNCSLVGRYVTISPPGNQSQRLVLCEVVLNEENATALMKPETTQNANYSDCERLTKWLRIDLQRPYLVSGISFRYDDNSVGIEEALEMLVGGWPSDERRDYTLCTTHLIGNESGGSASGECAPIFGQYVVIAINGTLDLCDIRLQHVPVLDLYSGRKVSASTQNGSAGLPQKAIDGYAVPVSQSCFVSDKRPNTWWRIEFDSIEIVFAVKINTISTALVEMAGFSVRVGNGSFSSNSNRLCGRYSNDTGNSTDIFLTCDTPAPSGKRVYVASANDAQSSLTLCEIQFFTCSPSQPIIVSDVNPILNRYEIEYNRTTVLTCSATGCPTPRVEWTKRNVVLSSVARMNGTGYLELNDGSDDGLYECRARNEIGASLTVPYFVSVRGLVVRGPQNATIDFGDVARLECLVFGLNHEWIPRPMVFNATTLGKRLFLGLAIVRGGTYRCATFSFGSDKSYEAATVFVRPNVSVAPALLSVPDGTRGLSVPCVAQGFPRPRITWLKDGRVLDDSILSDEFFVEPNNDQLIRSQRNLTFDVVRLNDTGVYTCEGTNSAASRSANFTLVVTLRPVFVSHPLGGRLLEGTNVTLSCVVIGFPLSGILWEWSMDANFLKFYNVTEVPGRITLIERDSERRGESQLLIDGVNRTESGYYRCHSGGVYSESAFIDVYYTPEIESQNEAVIYLNESQALNLSCTVFPIGFTNVTWLVLPEGSSNERIVSMSNRTRQFSSASGIDTLLIKESLIGDTGSYRCRAINEAGSAFSNATQVVVAGIPSVISTANVSFGRVTNQSFSVSWKEPFDGNGRIISYLVQYREEGRNEYAILFPAPTTPSATLLNLRPYQTYEILIQARNALGLSAMMSEPLTVRTLPGISSPPRNVSAVAASSTSIRVTWTPPEFPNGPIDYYRILYEIDGGSRRRRATSDFRDYPGSSTSVLLDGLEKFTSFLISVVVVNEVDGKQLVGRSRKGITVETSQDAPSSPRSVAANTIIGNSTTLNVTWTQPVAPNGVITTYVVDYRRTADEPWTESEASATTKRLERLEAATNYLVRVAAVTVERGSYSDVVNGWTAPLPPSIALSVSEARQSALVVFLPSKSSLSPRATKIQVLVAELPSGGQPFDFTHAESQRYRSNLGVGVPYVAVELLVDDEMASQVVLGTNETSGGYLNAALKRRTRYAYALRVFQRTDDGTELFSTSKSFLAETTDDTEEDSSNVGIIVGIVLGVVALLVIILVAFFFWRRRRSSKDRNLGFNSSLVIDNDRVEMTTGPRKENSRPQVTVLNRRASSAAGEITLINVHVTGNPKPKVTWRFFAQELPGRDSRVRVLESGSLQIQDTALVDSGLYKCIASNKAGSDTGQVQLSVEPGIADMPEMPDSIPAGDFEEHVYEMHASSNHGFSMEYQMLDGNERHPSLVANLAVNRDKNRYGNIAPYDHGRVVLQSIRGVEGSDYINASYLPGYGVPNAYIAAQGPSEKTVNDFWRMILQEKVPTIAMITKLEEKGKVKCYKYWPDNAEDYGEIVVTLQQETTLAECSVRTLDVFRELPDGSRTETHQTTQFHFTRWPEHGVPEYPTTLLNYLARVRAHHDAVRAQGPLLAHCSAGVGRTGTFLVVDYVIQRLADDNVVDIFGLVSEFRQRRPFMVQTEAQYVFCHDAVLDYILCGNTRISANELKRRVRHLEIVDRSSRLTGFENELLTLDKVSPHRKDFAYSCDKEMSSKNRYSYCLPPDKIRVHLSRRSDRPGDVGYINANYVDGYSRQAMYVTTQGPLSYTVGDFWRMVWELECTTVVMLTELEESGQELSAMYWPREGETKYDGFAVALMSEDVGPDFAVRKLLLEERKTSSTRDVVQFQYFNWTENCCPKSAASLLEMMGHLDKAQQQADNTPIVVLCSNGIGRSATFCAINIVIERLKAEQVADVFQVVKGLRLQNPEFVTSLEHYKFCYISATEFLDSFDSLCQF